ncbi:MAG: metallophosphoesterase [bacterium]
MKKCIHISDFHGSIYRYKNLIKYIGIHLPQIVFIGGDILPGGFNYIQNDEFSTGGFINDFLFKEFSALKEKLSGNYPRIFVILGNDDPAIYIDSMVSGEKMGLWEYIHNRKVEFETYSIYGYAYVPPTPFRLKDWEKYDVSRFTDAGDISPEKGIRSIAVPDDKIRYETIDKDIAKLVGDDDLSRAVFLFHSPPYQTNLDRVDRQGKMIDHAPLDVNVGSIAIRRFIEKKKPYVTLHGHIHESTRLTGNWQDKIGKTIMFNAAHEGTELSIVSFDLEHPEKATRVLI